MNLNEIIVKLKENNSEDLGTVVEVKTKESRSNKRPTRKASLENNKENSRNIKVLILS